MRMLKNTKTGMLYVYHEGLANAEGVEEVQVDHVTAPEPPQAPLAEPLAPEFPPEPDTDPLPPEPPAPDEAPAPVKSLDEMTRDELIAMAEFEERKRGDNRNLSRMKKADLITYIMAGDA